MPATLVCPTPKYQTYKVAGKTLVDIGKSFDRAGPVDPNDRKRVAFLTETKLDCNPEKGKFKASRAIKIDKKTGWFDAEMQINTLKVTMLTTITCPKRAVMGLSNPAFVEWLRFYGACILHEGRHVEKAKKEGQKIIKELNALRGSGLGETELDAEKDAKNNLIFEIHNFFDQQPDRLNKVHHAFDKSTGHGQSKGAKLDTSIV